MKPRKCKYPGCDKEVVNFANSTIKRKYCQDHAIEVVLEMQRKEALKMREQMEHLRKMRKLTPHQRFYQTTAWRYCSRFVKLVYADEDLMVPCATSGRLYRVNDPALICGHYLKADQHHATAFEFFNLAPQSAEQNNHNGGHMEEMARWIDRTHGPGTVEWLNQQKNQALRFDKTYLEEMAATYKKLFEDELNRRGIQDPWKNQ